MCSPVDMMNDSETHFLAELSAKIEPSGQYQDDRIHLPGLQCNNRALKPSCLIGSFSDVEVDHKWPYNPDYDYRSSSLEKMRHVSSISDHSTMSFGGLIEASSDDLLDKATLYSNESTSSLSPSSSAGLNNSVEEGSLSQLLYNMCLSPTATTGGRTGRPILGSQSTYSRQDKSLQDENIEKDCKSFNRKDGFYNTSQQQETVSRRTASGSIGLPPIEPSADALAALVHSLNYHTKQPEQQEQQQLQQRLQQLQQQRRQPLHSGLPSLLATLPSSCQHLGLPESLIGGRRSHHPLLKSQQPPVQRRFGYRGDELLQHSVTSQLPYSCQLPIRSDSRSIEEAAKRHRTAAATTQATCTWSGSVLPSRPLRDVVYSCKVFLGGVPWDITEPALASAFRQYGPIRVEWPLRDAASAQAKGYLYVLFESERLVAAMLDACIGDEGSGKRYFKISSRRMRFKEVQVIPWMIADSNHIAHSPNQQLEAQHTVFVGALHGMLTAETLARAMQNLFGGVLYAGIDTDKHKYPIGSGRVTFSNRRSFMRAVDAGFVEIKTNKFTKKVQIDPYLEDSLCSACSVQQGPYFCRDVSCFRYFCRVCWNWRHSDSFTSHKPLMRNPRSSASGSGRY